MSSNVVSPTGYLMLPTRLSHAPFSEKREGKDREIFRETKILFGWRDDKIRVLFPERDGSVFGASGKEQWGKQQRAVSPRSPPSDNVNI